MKMLKSILIGSAVATGVYMMYSDGFQKNGKKLMKTGRQVIKKMGIM